MAIRLFLESHARTPLGQGRGRLLAPVRWLFALAVIGAVFIVWLAVGLVPIALVLGWFTFQALLMIGPMLVLGGEGPTFAEVVHGTGLSGIPRRVRVHWGRWQAIIQREGIRDLLGWAFGPLASAGNRDVRV